MLATSRSLQSVLGMYGLVMLWSALPSGLVAADGALEDLAAAGQDSRRASSVALGLQNDPSTRLLDVLGAMKGKSAVAKNWYLSVAQTIADRDPQDSQSKLEQFLPRLSEDSDARYWAFRYLTRNDAQRREELLESFLADPSLELRYEAVEQRLQKLAEHTDWADSRKVAGYRELLAAARLPAQVQSIAEKLKELGEEVDLLQHFGFVSQWKLMGTFDNVGQRGFDVAFAPEEDYAKRALDFGKQYEGKAGKVSWRDASTEEPDGSIDLNALYDKEKGAIIYAAGAFRSGSDLECEVRIGCPNACKVWVNGQLLIGREVYHAGNQIDQYTAPVNLKAGENTILVKVCQNEQTEPWAQDWSFQLRFTDSTGFAVQPVR